MSKTTGIIALILTVLLGIFLYVRLCTCCTVESNQEPDKQAVSAQQPKATSNPLNFRDGEYGCESAENFNFNISSSVIKSPVDENVESCLASLKDYVGQENGKTIKITGYYKSNEDNTTAFPNLGLARANSVKQYLVAKGVLSSKIDTYGEENATMVPENDMYKGPIDIALETDAGGTDDEMQALYDKIKADPLVLHFEQAKASINLTADQKQKFADISRYLDKVDGAKCKVVGYTDSSGSRTTNIALGQKRADFAKSYLIDNGISPDKIIATSQGPDQPIASNDTPEGRAQNRRTVITLD